MKHSLHALLSMLFLGTLIASACGTSAPNPAQAGNDPSGTITISGAFALYPMMTVWADEFHKLHPGVEFDVQAGGAGKGMTDTLAGAADIGMISRVIKQEEEAQGAYWISVTKDAVFPVVSADNPVLNDLISKGLSQEVFKKIFITGEIKTWGEVIENPKVTDEIHVYTRSDSSGAADMWAQFSGGKAQTDILGIGVNSEPALVDTIAKDPLGIGYSNLNSVFDLTSGRVVQGVVVPPVDINGNGQANPGEYYTSKAEAVKAVSDGVYPSPPARFENLVTKGKPTGIVQVFLEWILTDGQGYLDQAGYIQLTAEQQAESLAKIK